MLIHHSGKPDFENVLDLLSSKKKLDEAANEHREQAAEAERIAYREQLRNELKDEILSESQQEEPNS